MYPLEQSPQSGNAERAFAPASQRRGDQLSSTSESGGAGLLLVLAGVAVAGAGLVVLALSRRRRRPSLAGPLTAVTALGAPPTPWPAAVPRAAPRTAARTGPVCQVRWNRRRACFYADTAGADGREQGVVRSPRLQHGQASPPERTRDAEAALRALAKELRNRGWRQLRAKGTDFDEPQWYARRYRWPTDDGGS